MIQPEAKRPQNMQPPDIHAARHAAMLAQTGFVGVDETDPTAPSGHAYGIRTSSRLTSNFRKRWRKEAMDVTPEEVIECFNEAGIKNWVLMGLHGYVGYLPMPRATQDVDVMVAYSEKNKAANAISARWPMLTQTTLSQVIRFADPSDLDADGKPQPVIDVMLPWSPFQKLILKEHVLKDESAKSRYPTVEAAIVSKYAPLISPHRSREKKAYDAGDFRRIVKANAADIDRDRLQQLAALVWEGGADDIEKFLELALSDQPFPV